MCGWGWGAGGGRDGRDVVCLLAWPPCQGASISMKRVCSMYHVVHGSSSTCHVAASRRESHSVVVASHQPPSMERGACACAQCRMRRGMAASSCRIPGAAGRIQNDDDDENVDGAFYHPPRAATRRDTPPAPRKNRTRTAHITPDTTYPAASHHTSSLAFATFLPISQPPPCFVLEHRLLSARQEKRNFKIDAFRGYYRRSTRFHAVWKAPSHAVLVVRLHPPRSSWLQPRVCEYFVKEWRRQLREKRRVTFSSLLFSSTPLLRPVLTPSHALFDPTFPASVSSQPRRSSTVPSTSFPLSLLLYYLLLNTVTYRYYLPSTQ